MDNKKKKVWFWPEKQGGGGVSIKEAEDIAAEHVSTEETMSHYSFSKGLLPPLGVNSGSTRRVKLRFFIVSPFDPRYRAWDWFLVLLVGYTAWASPFEFGYLQTPRAPLSIIDNVVNGFFAIDIVLTFFVAFLDKATYLLVDDPKRIAWRYVSSWLIFDVVSTIPYELFGSLLHNTIQGYGIFSMLRLWRLRRASNCFARLEKDRKYNYFWVRCTKLLLVALFVVHCGACFCYSIAAHYPDPSMTFMALAEPNWTQKSLLIRYVTAMYWSITTFSTTGYGDIHGNNASERAFILFYMIFNLGLLAYIIGNMTNLVVHVTSRTRNFRDTIQGASAFAQRNKLPERLQEQMVAHLSLRYRTDSEGLQQQEIIDSLPKAIRSSISHYLFYEVVDKIYLFHGISNDLLFQLVSEMKAEYFPPKEDVILRNEAPTDFYIMVTGAAEIIAPVNGVDQVVGEAQPGHVFGEVGVLCYRPQLFTVRTKRLSQLLRLNRTAFLNLVQANVGDGAIIMNNLLQHLKDSEDPVMKGILADTEQMLAQGKMDLPLSLCFAAARGDDLLLHQLLKRGSNPNETDKNGRTALHIAASKGCHYCVVLLLEHGADPNIKDSEGSVPLWEAIFGRHEEISKLLWDNGAKLSPDTVSHFSCLAVEHNSLDTLKDIVKYGGDTSLPDSNGTTALHRAVSEGNMEIVEFLLEQGADMDMPDVYGWTARGLAEHQGHEDIKALFQSQRPVEKKPKSVSGTPENVTPLMKHSSEPVMIHHRSRESMPFLRGGSQRRKLSNFKNSLFGIMSAANTGDEGESSTLSEGVGGVYPARVTISGEASSAGKVVKLPNSLEELIEIGEKKLGFVATKVLTREGAQIDDIRLIRDGTDLGDFRANPDYKGVCHVALAQEGHCRPGEVLLGTDSHTCTAGAFGQFATGIGNTDAGFVLGTGKILLKVPPTMRFILDGEMPSYLQAKDLILQIIGEISVAGATYKTMEFSGTTIESLTMEERMTLCNMVVEAGGKNGVIPPDATTFNYVENRTSVPFEPVYSDGNASFIADYRFDVSKLEPVVAKPHSPDNRALARECKDVKIDRVYIGSCTGGKTEDFMAAAKLFHAAGKQVKVPTFLVPATQKVWMDVYALPVPGAGGKTCAQIFKEAGCDTPTSPSCGACLGGPADTYARLNEPQVCVSTTNRNFPGRMGHKEGQIYLASPYTAAASALTGHVTDPREFLQ